MGFPQLSDAEKAELDAMSEEQLKKSFKAAGQVFSRGSSAYRGVDWHKGGLKWRATIRNGGVKKSLGCFESEKEAAHAYDQAVLARDGMCASPLHCIPGPPPRMHALAMEGILLYLLVHACRCMISCHTTVPSQV